MRYNTSYPKELVLENDYDKNFLINAMEKVIEDDISESLKEKARLIITWIKNN
jgi:hypothetical protein